MRQQQRNALLAYSALTIIALAALAASLYSYDRAQRRSNFAYTARFVPPAQLRAITIVRTIDGDTFIGSWHGDDGLIYYRRFRIWGIDAPELGSAGGARARHAFAKQFSQLRCAYRGTDRYQRLVVQCFDMTGNDVAKRLLEHTATCEWLRYSKGYYRSRKIC